MLEKFAKKHKLPDFRLRQFNKQFYQEAIESFDKLSTWPKDLREKLKKESERIRRTIAARRLELYNPSSHGR